MLMTCPRCWGAGGPCDRCDGKGRVADVQLSAHFRLSELLRSDTARRRGIPSDPGPCELRRLLALTRDLLQPMRDALGPLMVTSGYRAAPLNVAVGGSPTSAHVAGWAADVVPLDVTLEEGMAWIEAQQGGLAWDQVILEPGWIHVGLKRPPSGQQRQQLLFTTDGRTYRPWSTS